MVVERMMRMKTTTTTTDERFNRGLYPGPLGLVKLSESDPVDVGRAMKVLPFPVDALTLSQPNESMPLRTESVSRCVNQVRQ
jgi:hypothetical protein